MAQKTKKAAKEAEEIIEEKAEKVADVQEVEQIPEQKEQAFEMPYEIREWGAGIEVYCCLKCPAQYDAKDDIIIHVVNHYPPEKRTEILDKLLD